MEAMEALKDGQRSRGKKVLRWSFSAVMLITLGMLPASAQTDDLHMQLEQLKQQYDQTTHDLEQRISALEIDLRKSLTDKIGWSLATTTIHSASYDVS